MTEPTTPQPQPRYLSCAETATLVRSALKASFPGIKFSVRSSTYSMGASIDVSWTDGPTEAQVTAVTDRYRGADFDGSTDCKNYRPDTLVAVEGDLPEVVSFGADFIFASRRLSPEFVALLTDDLEQIEAEAGNGWEDTDIATRVRRYSMGVAVTAEREIRRVAA